MRSGSWFGLRRFVLKARFNVGRVNERIQERLRQGDPSVPLEQVHRRLELLLTAVYGRPIPIAPVDNNVWNRERVRNLTKRDPRERELASAVDSETIYLPPHVAARDGDAAAISHYRLLALEQAERIARGTAVHAPPPAADRLERDLYLLREGATIDAHIARTHPGVTDALREERQFALSRRPKLADLTAAEREVELAVRTALAEQPDKLEAPSSNPAASLQWARETATRIRSQGSTYRGLPLASVWGTLKMAEANVLNPRGEREGHRIRTGNTEALLQESRDKSSGGALTPDDAEDPGNPRDDGAGTAENDVPAFREEDRTSPITPHKGLAAGIDPFDANDPASLDGLPPAICYDEWNCETGAYVKRGAAVRLYDSTEGDASWSGMMLDRHAATVRHVRHQFERLRARRALLTRQRAGDELDLAACVNAIVDRRIGHPPDDRLYVDARPARRGLAIALLVDVSGSTEARVTTELRIIDLERIALLLASEALDALGDLYAVYAFAGKNSFNVKVTPVKEFGDRSGEAMWRRVDALEPGGFTRLGAAVRHATARLARQSAGHRLLLILSDGRPNDVDRYQGQYGVEDSRQAIMEARASGVYPFCITIDRDASEYLPRIFGAAGHTILQDPEQLPTALLRVVQALIRRR
jgi:nitric oxide reductase NorD protein